MKNQKYKCPCCEYLTLDEPPIDSYEICPVCYWEIDPLQINRPDYEGGANVVSLNQAKANYKKFGACDKRVLKYVRPPNRTEIKD
jgi:hypothetical protein